MSHDSVEHVSFTDHYETLRAWVTGQPRPVPRPAGLVLVVRQGVAGWLASWSLWLPSAPKDSSRIPGADTASVAAAPSLALVLASMVEQCRQERQP